MTIATPARQSKTYQVTASDLDLFSVCELQYYETCLKPGPRLRRHGTSYAMRLGSAVHELAKHVNDVYRDTGSWPSKEETFARHWNGSHFESHEEALGAWYDAQPMLDTYITFMSDYELRPLSAERGLATGPIQVFTGAQVVLKGRIDVITNGPMVLDLKTGKALTSKEGLSTKPSTALYRFLAHQAHGEGTNIEEIEVVHLLLTNGMIVRTSITEEQAQRVRALIHRMVTLRHNGNVSAFEPKINENCGSCPFRSQCPAYPDGDTTWDNLLG